MESGRSRLHARLERKPACEPGLGLQLHSIAVRTLYAFEGAFEERRGREAALSYKRETRCFMPTKNRSRTCDKAPVPAIYDRREFVEVSGLMSYGPDSAVFRRAAYFVDRILRGAKPRELPVERPTKFELVINLRTAKEIGVTIHLTCSCGRTK